MCRKFYLRKKQNKEAHFIHKVKGSNFDWSQLPSNQYKQKPRKAHFHLDKWAERLLARKDMVVADTPLVPPKYHFLIISTTFLFSTFIFASSLPPVLNAICPHWTNPSNGLVPALLKNQYKLWSCRVFTSAAAGETGKWYVITESFLKYLDWKNSTIFSKASSSSSSYLSSAANLSRTALSSCTPYWDPLISLITTTLMNFSTGAAHFNWKKNISLGYGKLFHYIYAAEENVLSTSNKSVKEVIIFC